MNKLVDIDLAKKLKLIGYNVPGFYFYDLGFEEPKLKTDNFYYGDEEGCIEGEDFKENWNLHPDLMSAPTLHEAMNWLLEKHNVFVKVNYIHSSKRWDYEITVLDNPDYRCINGTFADYDTALEKGISVAVNNLLYSA